MHSHSKPHLVTLQCGLAFVGTLFLARPAQADQIIALVDERGRKIYINTGDRPVRRGARMTPSFRPLPSSTPTQPSGDIHFIVDETANRFELDPELIHAIIKVESEYNPNAVSRRGAAGLMQLIPATAQRFGVNNPFDPKQNIEGGVTYLKYLLDLFGGDLSLSLAAYNAGENSVLRYGGIPSITETRNYVRRVTGLYKSGFSSTAARQTPKEPAKAPIYRYVDARGVVHFTNGYEF